MVEIFTPRKQKIAATLVVRDEEDIIENMLIHSISEGITHFFVTDNNSKDATARVVGKFPEVVSIVFSDDMSHHQEKHTTAMAREAFRYGVDWIIHMDADEFWCGMGSMAMKEWNYDALYSTIAHVHPPVPSATGSIAPLDRMMKYVDFHGHAREFKIMHRPHPDIVIKHGNHGAVGCGEIGTCDTVYRHHYPIRTPNQFDRKVRQGATALKSRKYVCERWYAWHEELKQGRLNQIYQSMAAPWIGLSIGDVPDRVVLSEILIQGYKVNRQLVHDIFNGLDDDGLSPIVKEWIPPTFRQRRVFV